MPQGGNSSFMPPGSQIPPSQQQHQLSMMQIPPIMSTTIAPSGMMNMQNPNYQQSQINQNIPPNHQQQQQIMNQQQQQQYSQQIPMQTQQQQPNVPVVQQPPAEPEKPKEVETAELISFD